MPLPKCASSSIKSWIYEIEFGEKFSAEECKTCGNKTIHNCKCLCQTTVAEISDNSFKFTIVKNPYSRILSTFLNKVIEDMKWSTDDPETIGNKFLLYMNKKKMMIKDDDVTFLEFIKSVIDENTNLSIDSHLMLQTDLMLFDDIKYDFVGRLEQLGHSMDTIREKLNVECALPDKVNIGVPPPTDASGKNRNYYCPEAMELVYRYYREDFNKLGYEKI